MRTILQYRVFAQGDDCNMEWSYIFVCSHIEKYRHTMARVQACIGSILYYFAEWSSHSI